MGRIGGKAEAPNTPCPGPFRSADHEVQGAQEEAAEGAEDDERDGALDELGHVLLGLGLCLHGASWRYRAASYRRSRRTVAVQIL